MYFLLHYIQLTAKSQIQILHKETYDKHIKYNAYLHI